MLFGSPHRWVAILAVCFTSLLSAQALRRPLLISQSQYRVVAGDRVAIQAPSETLTFMRSAKTGVARASGVNNRTFPVGPNVAGDQVLLGVPLMAEPGDYSVALSFVNDAGEERAATIQVRVEPFATAAAESSVPPVVLLDGWQGASGCPQANDSTQTFGNLAAYLQGTPNFAPAVYFFENCTQCPDCAIEQLGADLGTFLNSLRYSDGTAVQQVDVIAHSMGGLIVRSYLSGKQQTPGAFSPPVTTKIRKAVFLATPHFGSYQADSSLGALFPGNQVSEMKRGSQFLWDLATWNQFGDDLRGVDALAVIGNAGSFTNLPQASDGLVGLSSGSLDFAKPGRTRIVNYCHVSLGFYAALLGCTAPGIANIDAPSHPSYQIVSSFLLASSAWQSVGNSPAQDQYLSKFGGMVVADVSAAGQFVSSLSGVSWGSMALSAGAASGELYYSDFLSGTGSFSFGNSTCGPFTETAGVYSAVRCKGGPAVHSIGPLLPGPGKVVQAGTTITISGTGFGAQQCGTCRVTASSPQSSALQISSWSDTAIQAMLPASLGMGIVQIGVTTANGSDAINIMAGTSSVSTGPVVTLVANAFGDTPLIAPNTWVEIKGTNLAPAGDTRIWQLSDFANNQLPTQLDGVSVTVNGKNAFLYYINPTQINILTPPDALPGSVQAQVTNNGVTSNVAAVQAQPQSLSFFEFVSSGSLHYVVGRHTSDNSYIGPPNLLPGVTTTPVRPGEPMYVVATGFGTTDVPIVSGALSQSGNLPAPFPVVKIGGIQASVSFAGLVGVGTYQLNLIVPDDVPDGDLPLTATYDGLSIQPNLLITVQH